MHIDNFVSLPGFVIECSNSINEHTYETNENYFQIMGNYIYTLTHNYCYEWDIYQMHGTQQTETIPIIQTEECSTSTIQSVFFRSLG